MLNFIEFTGNSHKSILKKLTILKLVVVAGLIFPSIILAQDITISQHTTWNSGTYTYDNVTITNGAILTFDGKVTLNAQNLTIDSGCSIFADGKGYPSGTGPGTGSMGHRDAGGGSYGGHGGANNIGDTYGSALAPIDLGSGGAPTYGKPGGAGGGAVLLNITDTLSIIGIISANGSDGIYDPGGNPNHSGAGSGGSVIIHAGNITGSGKITTNGGNGGKDGGGGGGGRISIHYNTSSFIGTTESKGGNSGPTKPQSEAGTVVLVDESNNILYTGHSFRFQDNDSPFNYSAIVISNSQATTQGNITLSLNELNLNNSSSLTLNDSASLVINSALNVNNHSSFQFNGVQALSVPLITLNSTSTIILSGKESLVINNLVLKDHSILTHISQGSINLDLVNLSIDETSSVSADGKGYPANEGPGTGSLGNEAHYTLGGGGGYGGKGGGDIGGPVYGSEIVPVDLGSGGRLVNMWGYQGSAGGGAARIVAENIVLEGRISANGEDGGSDSNGRSGGGSGGSIYIIADTISGSGAITANGGNSDRSGGGGGRVAIYYQTYSLSGNIEATGGHAYHEGTGENGTIVSKNLSDEDMPFTYFKLEEQTSTSAELLETVTICNALISNTTIYGSLDGSIDFTNFEITIINSDIFDNSGFFKAEWQAVLEGTTYQGIYEGVYSPDSKRPVYLLKGRINGDLKGIAETVLRESQKGSYVYDIFESIWKINYISTEISSATINVNGNVSYDALNSFSSQIMFYQGSYQGLCKGSYSGPLNAMVTHVRLIEEDFYNREGFSFMSYNTDLGYGESWCYSYMKDKNHWDLVGLIDGVLEGELLASSNEFTAPKIISGNIIRLDIGMPPLADLQVNSLGHHSVSPGETVTYIVEIKNNGLIIAEEVVVISQLPEKVDYIESSNNGVYWPKRHQVIWKLDTIQVQEKSYLWIKVRYPWGLKDGSIHQITTTIETKTPNKNENIFPIEIEEYMNYKPVNIISNTSLNNVEINDLLLDLSLKELYDFAVDLGFTPTDIADRTEYSSNEKLTRLLMDNTTSDEILFVIKLSSGIENMYFMEKHSTCTYTILDKTGGIIYNLEDESYTSFGDWGDLGINTMSKLNTQAVGINAGISGNSQRNTSNGCNRSQCIANCALSCLLPSIPGKCWADCIINPSDGCSGCILSPYCYVKCVKDCMKDPNSNCCKFGDENKTVCEGCWNSRSGVCVRKYVCVFPGVWELYESIPAGCTWGLESYLLESCYYCEACINGVSYCDKCQDGMFKSIMVVALDPNAKYGPEGDVEPGQKLDYKVEFENEGEGIAFGVYFTDTLDEDLDDSTLLIGPVKSTADDSIIAPAGTYDPGTRTITWMVGEVGPHKGGYTELSVNVSTSAKDGDEIINYATVYFPSVPEVTHTNGVVNTVKIINDELPPETICNINPLSNDAGWNNSDVTVTLNATDYGEDITGVKEIRYTLSGATSADEVINSDTIEISITNEGITTLTYYAVDNEDNHEEPESIEINIDKTAPVLSSAITPGPNSAGWNHSDVIVTFNAADQLSGILSVTDPVSVTTEGINHEVLGEAYDIADNISSITAVVNIDNTPPVTTLHISPQPDVAGWNNSVPVNVTFSAEDNLSGILYSPDPITFDTEGIYTSFYSSIDIAENNEIEKAYTVKIDITAPVLECPADIELEATAELTPLDIGEASATDANQVSIENDAPVSGTYPIGTTVVTWTATDEVGNISTATQEITVVDTTPPALDVPDNITVEATQVPMPVDIGQAQASDIADPNLTVTNNAPQDGLYPVGTTIVTWQAQDASGNVTTAEQTITVTEPPQEVVEVKVKIKPEALLLTKRSRVIAFIKIPKPYKVSKVIDVTCDGAPYSRKLVLRRRNMLILSFKTKHMTELPIDKHFTITGTLEHEGKTIDFQGEDSIRKVIKPRKNKKRFR